MKRYWIEYSDVPPASPMTFWVHRRIATRDHLPGEIVFDPPRQAVVAGIGFPVFFVECNGFTFEFASIDELKTCANVLGQKHLPRSIDLSAAHGSGAGPNRHWLSRLPAHTKSWKYREKAVKFLNEALGDFEKQLDARS